MSSVLFVLTTNQSNCGASSLRYHLSAALGTRMMTRTCRTTRKSFTTQRSRCLSTRWQRRLLTCTHPRPRPLRLTCSPPSQITTTRRKCLWVDGRHFGLPSHYLNHWWLINQMPGNTFPWNLNQTTKGLFQVNASGYVVCQMAAIFVRPECAEYIKVSYSRTSV